eukprot:TRINITY_DN153_c0_g1_i1.p1 TRINITY_DN153_c0_g1~~TRINITY_DN153_c0_g1_i1.p1  ORF type:complete len:320 (-),score=63.72 TRINITY_DN153_c0_g1_i1:114-1073(-)
MEWLWYLGAVVVIKFLVWDLFRTLYKRCIRGAADLTRYGAKSGSVWAVVTGASEGIGKAYAIELAKRGFNVVILSRTLKKLQEAQREINTSYPKVQVEVKDFDFGSDKPNYAMIEDFLKDKDVGILVNNVGVNYPYPANYLDTEPQKNNQIVDVNVKALNEMTRIVMPIMIKRKAGGIINVSSFSGVVPAPMLSVYSGTKAYINFFSLCLATEYKRSGIDVLSVTPSMVVSNMSKFRQPSLLKGVTSADKVARGSLNVLGLETHWSPFWLHALLEYVFQRLPSATVLDKINEMHIGIRKRALRKEELAKQQTTNNKKDK